MKGSDNMLTLFQPAPASKRWYIVDRKGNKLYYGTKSECQKFIKYIERSKQEWIFGKRQTDR